MNVWEDGQEKVEKFVKDKGDGMSYPVAFTGKGSAFEKEWLVAAGVHGIPHAFVVKDGKILLTTHPAKLSEELIEALLAGGEAAQKVVDGLAAGKADEDKRRTMMMDFQKASMTGDTETMASKIADLEKNEPSSPYLPMMKFDLLLAKKDWPAASKLLTGMPEGPARDMAVMRTAGKISGSKEGDYPVDFIKAILKSVESVTANSKMPANPISMITVSTLQWKSGDKEAAVAGAKKAAEQAKEASSKAGPTGRKLPVEPFDRFAKEMEAGNPPSSQEFMGWLREEMMKSTKPAPAKE
jgi:hypothetical protein